jgi:hydrogenase maturation protease
MPYPNTLVIGYGSPIRGDDALGPLAAEALAAGPLPPGVSVISRHILTADLVADLAASDRVIFIDASVAGEPGEIRVQPLTADVSALSTMAHFLDPRELLAWCQALYQRQPQAYLVTATGESFEYANYSLSPVATSALASLLAQVRELIAETPALTVPYPA